MPVKHWRSASYASTIAKQNQCRISPRRQMTSHAALLKSAWQIRVTGLKEDVSRYRIANKSVLRSASRSYSDVSRRPKPRMVTSCSTKDVQVLGGIDRRDLDILALLIPALGSVFLDPAMQVIDTGLPNLLLRYSFYFVERFAPMLKLGNFSKS